MHWQQLRSTEPPQPLQSACLEGQRADAATVPRQLRPVPQVTPLGAPQLHPALRPRRFAHGTQAAIYLQVGQAECRGCGFAGHGRICESTMAESACHRLFMSTRSTRARLEAHSRQRAGTHCRPTCRQPMSGDKAGDWCGWCARQGCSPAPPASSATSRQAGKAPSCLRPPPSSGGGASSDSCGRVAARMGASRSQGTCCAGPRLPALLAPLPQPQIEQGQPFF